MNHFLVVVLFLPSFYILMQTNFPHTLITLMEVIFFRFLLIFLI